MGMQVYAGAVLKFHAEIIAAAQPEVKKAELPPGNRQRVACRLGVLLAAGGRLGGEPVGKPCRH